MVHIYWFFFFLRSYCDYLSDFREAVIIEEVSMEEEEPICTFDDDADPSIERCSDYADEPDMRMKNAAAGALPENSFSREPLILGMAGITLACAIAMAMMFLRDRRAKRAGVSAADPAESTERTLAKPLNGKAQPPGVGHQEDAPAEAQPESRVKELKLVLERETKEKQGLSEQNNFLKSALEERKATVQMFTSELQVRIHLLLLTKSHPPRDCVSTKDYFPFSIESGRTAGDFRTRANQGQERTLQPN